MTVRVVVLGAGGVARRHVEVLSSLDGVEVVAVADPVRAAADALADLAGARAFSAVEDALDAGPVDAAYVCVPPFAHGELERAVVAAGVPFFVEKPIADDLAVAEDVAARVADAGLPSQRVVGGTVADIAARTADAGFTPPAVTVIGAVAGFDPYQP